MHALPIVAEVVHIGFGQHIGFRQNYAIALSPLKELAKSAQHIELLLRFLNGRALGRNDKRHGIHAKPGDPQLDPEAHDLEYLSLHFRV